MSKEARIYMRASEAQKARWLEAARRDGFFEWGEPNLTAWLTYAAERQVERPSPRAARVSRS